MIRRAFKYRLYPTAAQEATLRQFVGVTRLVYNLALEQRRDWWRQYRTATGGALNYASQGRQVTELRREFDWIGAVPSSCLHQALRDLDKAFANFFAGRGAGFPSLRRRGVNDSFRIQGKETEVRQDGSRWGAVRIPNLGWIRFRDTRTIAGKLVNVTIRCEAGDWFLACACEIEHEAPANDNPAVGIDRGVACTLALSNGETMNAPRLSALDRHKKRWQRTLARRKRGSARHGKARRRVAALAARMARIHRDWQHRASTDIARRFGYVALEKLAIPNMTAAGRGKRGLNRSILEQGWGAFATMIQYKLEERGGALVYVNPAYTSQTCSDCGTVDRRSRESQASFACVECGFRANADHNAAIVILRRSTASMSVEGRGCAPDEAGTMREAA